MQTVTRKTLWGTFDGKQIPLEELSDSHLLNVLWLNRENAKKIKKALANSKSDDIYKNMVLVDRLDTYLQIAKVITEIAEDRGFDKTKIGKKQMPFFRNGEWFKYSPTKQKIIKTSEPKIKDLALYRKDPSDALDYYKNLESF